MAASNSPIPNFFSFTSTGMWVTWFVMSRINSMGPGSTLVRIRIRTPVAANVFRNDPKVGNGTGAILTTRETRYEVMVF